MTNSKNNLLSPNTSKNKRRRHKRSAPTLADHMGRLALNQQLSSSQRMLIKLSPSWHEWLRGKLNGDLTNSAVLSHYADGKLLISCDNSVIASQIKHQQTSIINFLNQANFKDIHTISIRIEHPKHVSAERTLVQSEDTIEQGEAYCQPSSNSLESISHCRQTVKSDILSESLQRLERTLKDN